MTDETNEKKAEPTAIDSKPEVRRWAAELASDITKHNPTTKFEKLTLRLVRFHETGLFAEVDGSSETET